LLVSPLLLIPLGFEQRQLGKLGIDAAFSSTSGLPDAKAFTSA
jgi:hypothetical protein